MVLTSHTYPVKTVLLVRIRGIGDIVAKGCEDVSGVARTVLERKRVGAILS